MVRLPRPFPHSDDDDGAIIQRLLPDEFIENETDTTTPTAGRSAILGFIGGLIATCALTVFRMPVSRSLPPTANFWAEYVAGGDLSEHRVEAMVIHLLYGAIGGSVFALLFRAIDARMPTGTELNGLVIGVLTSIPFSVFGTRVVLNRVLGMDLDANEVMIFHAGHLVYGITIGAWVGSRMSTND